MAKTKIEHIKSASRTHSNHSKTKSQAQIKTETVASFFQGKKKKKKLGTHTLRIL